MTALTTPPSSTDQHEIAINTIRFLAVDMVEKANSGHPGAPMGQAAMAYHLWTKHLRIDPAQTDWPNRDRFVLSCGHASALLYSLLHLSGHDLSLDDLKQFRQWNSKTPGHPEQHMTPGIETTTGPLGQGVGNAVGMAIAQRMLASRFNRPEFPLFDYRTWVIASDGDLMEGVAAEASSLAGHLGLGNLVVLYDDNQISIDGPTSLSFSERVDARYESYGWQVSRVENGNDRVALEEAIQAALEDTSRPSLISVRTHIGFGSPAKQDSSSSHGSPLGPDEVKATKEALGWPLEPTFHVPQEALDAFAPIGQQGSARHAEWRSLLHSYREDHASEASELERRLAGELPAQWTDQLPHFEPSDGPIATRKASGKVIDAIGESLPEFVGGSADLTGSTNTYQSGLGEFSAHDFGGKNFYWGVREHGMGATLNGMALGKAFRPYGATFLIFSDYMRPSIRLAALMEQPVLYVLTHDSIFLGEDGPTHQPISQLLSLRSIPGLTVIRPADANETAIAWQLALEHQDGPTAVILTRQGLPIHPDTQRVREGTLRGGYVLSDAENGDAQAVLIATGSEVALALAAQEELRKIELETRVVSIPSWEVFDAQDAEYRESVLPSSIPRRLAIEAASPMGWERYVGDHGRVFGIDGFGASAPASELAEHYGFTPSNIAQQVRDLLDE